MKTKLTPYNGPSMNLRDGKGVLYVGGRLVNWWLGDEKTAEAHWQKLLAEDRAIKNRAAKNNSEKKSAVRKPLAKKPAVRATRRTT